MKPLFVPLFTKYYEAFANGTKTHEYRIYGPRWNEQTCLVGRAAILSKGYGTRDRLRGVISDFQCVPARSLPSAVQADIIACFGTLDHDIACIGFEGIKGA